MSKELYAVPACACLRLRMAARELTQAYDRALRPAGLRTTQFSLLNAARLLGPCSFQTLADSLALDKTTLPRNLRPLERRGLLRVEPGEDRRERLVSLTREGKKALLRAAGYWRDAQTRLVERMGEKRFEALLGELEGLRAAAAGSLRP